MLIITALITCLLSTLATHLLLTRKRSIPYCIAAYILNTIIVISGVYLAARFIHNPMLQKFLSYVVGFSYFIYIYAVFKESLSKKLFTMFSIWVFSTSLLVLVNSIFNIITQEFESTIIPDNVQIIRLILFVLLLPIVHFGLSKSYKRILSIVPDKTIYFMSLYPIIAFILQINTFSSTLGNFRNLYSPYVDLLIVLFISLGYVLVFSGISAASKKVTLEYTYKIIENQVELQRQNYKSLNESLQQLYALRHDVRHHVSTIETLVKQQKFIEVMDYIDHFSKSELFKNTPMLCSNFAADSIVKYNMSQALSKNIEFEVGLNIPEDIGINPLDLCIVLGNCLENAIEACEKQEAGTKKFIELKSEIVDTHIIFRIRNSYNGKLADEESLIKSSKDDEYHGIGLSNVRETVRRYKGDVNIKRTDNNFEITIIMCTSTSVYATRTVRY